MCLGSGSALDPLLPLLPWLWSLRHGPAPQKGSPTQPLLAWGSGLCLLCDAGLTSPLLLLSRASGSGAAEHSRPEVTTEARPLVVSREAMPKPTSRWVLSGQRWTEASASHCLGLPCLELGVILLQMKETLFP